MTFKNILRWFIIIFLIVSLALFIFSVIKTFNEEKIQKKILDGFTLEGNETSNGSISMNKNDAFCDKYRGSSGELNGKCGALTKNNCGDTSCCVWTSDQKCVAGNAQGPTFNSGENGKTKIHDYYYFQNKCYGDKCSTEQAV